MSKRKAITFSLLAGTLVLGASGGLSCIRHLDAFAFLWLPGAFFGAIFFPEGIEGDHVFSYIAVSALADIALYATFAYFAYFGRELP